MNFKGDKDEMDKALIRSHDRIFTYMFFFLILQKQNQHNCIELPFTRGCWLNRLVFGGHKLDGSIQTDHILAASEIHKAQ